MTTAYLPLGAVVVAGGKVAFADGAGMIVLPAPVVPPIEPPVDTGGGYAGGGGRRMIRKYRRKREDEDEPLEVIATVPARPLPAPPAPPPIPPQPGLMAGILMPPPLVLRSPKVENDDDEAIALLLETLFS